MPIYEYECKKCGRVTTVLQKMSDKAPSTCEYCGENDSLVKRVSHSSFVLKGGGWFKDCYPDAKNSGTSAYKEDSGTTGSDSGTSKAKEDCPCCSCPASKDCPSSSSSHQST